MEDERFGPHTAKAEPGGRILIPARYCKRISWLADEESSLTVWLLLLQPGRFRLLSDSEVAESEEICPIRSLILEGPAKEDASPTVFELAERAARIGRLIRTNLSSSNSGWRLTIPKQAASKEDTFVLLFSLGRLEVWTPGAYNLALAHPLADIL